jgi:hypothetical protein
LHMCCFFTNCSFANILSALLILLTSGQNYGQNRPAEWNVTDVPEQDDTHVKVERLHLSNWRQISPSIRNSLPDCL